MLCRSRRATLRRGEKEKKGNAMHWQVGRNGMIDAVLGSEDFGPSISSSCCPRQDLRGMQRRERFGVTLVTTHSFPPCRWQGHRGGLLSSQKENHSEVNWTWEADIPWWKGTFIILHQIGLSPLRLYGDFFRFIVKATWFMFMWILTSSVIYTEPVIQQLQY